VSLLSNMKDIWIRTDECSQRATLMSQLVTDACDVWIPSNNLGYTNLNDGIIGLLG
jgi:hypothetical protein